VIDAVVFDMDGVLIDAKEWHYEALNRALGLLGYSISRYDHLSRYDGLMFLRINALGAWCLGLSEDYEPEAVKADAVVSKDELQTALLPAVARLSRETVGLARTAGV